jgi:hypothetical protein
MRCQPTADRTSIAKDLAVRGAGESICISIYLNDKRTCDAQSFNPVWSWRVVGGRMRDDWLVMREVCCVLVWVSCLAGCSAVAFAGCTLVGGCGIDESGCVLRVEIVTFTGEYVSCVCCFLLSCSCVSFLAHLLTENSTAIFRVTKPGERLLLISRQTNTSLPQTSKAKATASQLPSLLPFTTNVTLSVGEQSNHIYSQTSSKH